MRNRPQLRRPLRIPRPPRPSPAGCRAPRRSPLGARLQPEIWPRQGPGRALPRWLTRSVLRPRQPPPAPTPHSVAPLPRAHGIRQPPPQQPMAPRSSRLPTIRPVAGQPPLQAAPTPHRVRPAEPLDAPARSLRGSLRPVEPLTLHGPRQRDHPAPGRLRTSPSRRPHDRRPTRFRPRRGARPRGPTPQPPHSAGPTQPPTVPTQPLGRLPPVGRPVPTGPAPSPVAAPPARHGCLGPARATPPNGPVGHPDRRRPGPPTQPRQLPPRRRSGSAPLCALTQRQPASIGSQPHHGPGFVIQSARVRPDGASKL